MSNEKTLGISGIAIKPERLRSLQPEKVAELAASMAKLGQLQPIIVRPVGKTGSGNGYWLIAGRHRLEAAKQLKWPAILATVLENVKADTAELIEIDENLIRAELSPAERADHVGRRKALYEKLHPETKHGAAPGKAGGGKKAKGTKLGSFTKATAKATGQSATKIKRDATRAKDLDKLLGRINGTSLDKGAEMDALRKLPEEEQEILVARAAAGEQVSAREAEGGAGGEEEEAGAGRGAGGRAEGQADNRGRGGRAGG
jgi:ParB family transcriptional regulator, chromosome partitioning protein